MDRMVSEAVPDQQQPVRSQQVLNRPTAVIWPHTDGRYPRLPPCQPRYRIRARRPQSRYKTGILRHALATAIRGSNRAASSVSPQYRREVLRAHDVSRRRTQVSSIRGRNLSDMKSAMNRADSGAPRSAEPERAQ
jgi:hypothetical protein